MAAPQFILIAGPNGAVERVAERVRNGGHNIPEDVIRRRHISGWKNFLEIYQALADYWEVYANLGFGPFTLVAEGNHLKNIDIIEEDLWLQMNQGTTMDYKDIVKETQPIYNSVSRIHELAVQQAVRKALLEHKRASNPVAIWRDGKVVIVPPEEIDISEEEFA